MQRADECSFLTTLSKTLSGSGLKRKVASGEFIEDRFWGGGLKRGVVFIQKGLL